jgi:hypothetical protein
MSELTSCTKTPVSSETGFLKHRWRSMRFFFARRAFESKLERILRAAYGHEGNALPAGDHEYKLLNTEGDSVCTEFADRWGLDVDLVKARIPGLAKLEGLAVPPPTKNYARLACLAMIAIPLALFLMGAVAGLFNVGFHLVGGR